MSLDTPKRLDNPAHGSAPILTKIRATGGIMHVYLDVALFMSILIWLYPCIS